MTEKQVDTFTLGAGIKWVTIETLAGRQLLSEYDIVLSCLEGLSTRRLMHHVQFLRKRPLLISAYPGLVLRYAHDGFSMRTASDLFWLNSIADLQAYRDMCGAFGLPSDNARVFGVASLLRKPIRKPDAERGPVVFFEQAIIPRYRDERLFLCEQLIHLAQRFPQYEFVLKPRVVGSEATVHRSQYPIVPLFDEAVSRLNSRPLNLRISTASATELIEAASHCLTVSSTVAVEAINAGVPTAIVSDFGAHEDYGLHYFFKSGIIRSFAELEFPLTCRPNPEWVRDAYTDPNKTVGELVLEAVSLAGREKGKLTPELQRAEMSRSLRERLFEMNGIEKTLSRRYQTTVNRRGWVWRNLTAIYVSVRRTIAKWWKRSAKR